MKCPHCNQEMPTEVDIAMDKIIESWNNLRLPKVTNLTSSRKRHLKARLKEPMFVNNWEELFMKVKRSDFLTGKNGYDWKVDFSWIIANNNNYVKVLEGKYDNKVKNYGKCRCRKGPADGIGTDDAGIEYTWCRHCQPGRWERSCKDGMGPMAGLLG